MTIENGPPIRRYFARRAQVSIKVSGYYWDLETSESSRVELVGNVISTINRAYQLLHKNDNHGIKL